MKKFKHLPLSFFLLLTFQLSSQITVIGDLLLNDSTQVHILSMENGDQFTGKVLQYDKSTLHFLYHGNKLVFPTKEVELVKVKMIGEKENQGKKGLILEETAEIKNEPHSQIHLSPYEYRLISPNGKHLIGKILRIDKKGVLMGAENKVVIKNLLVSSIEKMGPMITETPSPLKEYHRLQTTNGSSFLGQLISYDGMEYVFLMKNGSALKYLEEEVEYIRMEMDNGLIADERRIRPIKSYYNQQRMFFSPSAFLMEEKSKEYRSYLVYNTLDFGLSKHVSAGVGMFTMLIVNGISGKFKVGTSVFDHLHIAAGANGITLIESYEGSTFILGLTYGAVTVGTNDRFINLSAGFGKTSEDRYGTAGYSLGGSFKTDENWRVYFEYMFFNPREGDNDYYENENYTMGTLGLSWFNQKHQIDFGLHANSSFETDLTAVPVIAYSLRF